MKRIHLVFIAFNFLGIIYAQIDPRGDVFLSHQPVWSHVAFDTTAVGYKGRNGTDNYRNLANDKILIQGDSAILVYRNFQDVYGGSFIEKIDLKSGRSIWQNSFDLRSHEKQQYTSNFFINDKGELELLNFTHNMDTFFGFWHSGKLSIYKYNPYTGELVSKFHSDLNNPAYPVFGLDGNSTRFSKFHQSVKYSTFWSLSSAGLTFLMQYLDDSLKIFKTDTTALPMKYTKVNPYALTHFYVHENPDTFVALRHSYPKVPYRTGGELDVSVDFFDGNMKLIDSFNITSQIDSVAIYYIHNARNRHVCIFSVETFPNSLDERQRLICVNTKGEIVEQVIYQHTKLHEFGECVGMYKLRDEPGMFIINKSAIGNNPEVVHLFFYKSDGQGNLTLLKDIIMKDRYTLTYNVIEQLENGDILLSGVFRKRGSASQDIIKNERFITSRWSAKDLGLVSKTDPERKSAHSIVVYPNPSSGQIFFNGLRQVSFKARIYSTHGQLLAEKLFADGQDASWQLPDHISGSCILQLERASDHVLLFAGPLVIHVK